MRLDIRVRSGPDLFVRNNIAKMILSMNLNIRGTATAVAPAGRIKALEGRVYFQNQDFAITRGSLDFLGEAGSYPSLRLESRAEVKGNTRNYKIYLSMNGPLDRIELTMTSIPTLSQEDILFVLFTGMKREEYFAKPSDMKNSASGLAASGLAGLFGKDIQAWTGLDTFEMGGYEGEGFGVKTTVGKRFGERMELRGTLSVGEKLNRGEAQMQYQVAEGVYLVGTQRTDGSYGLDIRFRFVGR
jgi:autotransporter translocation and assembly factor TamB